MDGLTKRSDRAGALAAGLAIVAVAMVLDRVSRSFAYADRTKPVDRGRGLGGLAVVGRSGPGGPVVRVRSTSPQCGESAVLDPIDALRDLGTGQPLFHHPPGQRLHRRWLDDPGP